MAENSKIEWTDHTFNPWIGCTKVSPACDNCYAESFARRTAGPAWGKGEPRRLTSDANWKKPLAWDRKAARLGVRYRVLCASLADVFDVEVPDDWRDRLLALIAATPHLDWLLLTKRPKVARDYLTAQTIIRAIPHGPIGAPGGGFYDPAVDGIVRNLWLGTTVENQAMADARIPHLLAAPAAKRFLSCEPLLGPVDLASVRPHGRAEANALLGFDFDQGIACNGLDWVIAGGESGAKARPSHPEWFRDLRDQCAEAGVPFKQWGEWAPGMAPPVAAVHPDGDVQRDVRCDGDDWCHMTRIGKARAGRELDGQIHDAFPARHQGETHPMSIECAECERDLRGGHAEDCSRHPAAGLEMVPFRMATADCGWLWRCGYRVGHLVVHEIDRPKRGQDARWIVSHAETGFGMPVDKTGSMDLSDAISLAGALDAAVEWGSLRRGPSGEPGDIVGFQTIKRKVSAALNAWLRRNRINVDGETAR